MLETNLKVVAPGQELSVPVQPVSVLGSLGGRDILERVCARLARQVAMPCVPLSEASAEICIPSGGIVDHLPTSVVGDDWQVGLEVRRGSRDLRWQTVDDRRLIQRLLERALQISVRRRTTLWTLDSPRIWYEDTPFAQERGITAYRRFAASAWSVDGVGAAIGVDLSTAFFSAYPVSYFLDDSVGEGERARRQALFATYCQRQSGQKGTLMYDVGQSRHKCYFEAAPVGVTCSTTGPIRVQGKSYSSLVDYYRAAHPGLAGCANVRAVQVSFPGLARPQWVRSDRLFVRLMNDMLGPGLRNQAALSTGTRRRQISAFWDRIGPDPFGLIAPGGGLTGLWQPGESQVVTVPFPALEFGGGRVVAPPSKATASAVAANYRERRLTLLDAGMYRASAAAPREVYCAVPRALKGAGSKLATDVVALATRLTGHHFVAVPVEYDEVLHCIATMRRAGDHGVSLFVLDRDPVSYFRVAYELPTWRLKRVTAVQLLRQYEAAKREPGRWNSFVFLCTLDLLQKLDCIPWRVDQLGAYDAIVTIDVGRDRRHVALSVLLAREPTSPPGLRLYSAVHNKLDTQQEAINRVLLADHVRDIFRAVWQADCAPLRSVLVLRDGRSVGAELEGLKQAADRLRSDGVLEQAGCMHVADLQKDSVRPLRVWARAGDSVENPLEGTTVLLGNDEVAVCCTGVATLHRGTVEPLVIRMRSPGMVAVEVARAVFAAAQLNWSSPTVAQRLPLPLKRTDEELIARAASEIRRIS